jgi:competence protein ComEC
MLDVLRRQGVRHLDRVVLSHPHPDHYGGLEALLRELDVDELDVPRPPRPAGGESELAFARLLALAPVVRFAQVGGPAQVLHPLAGWTSPARDPVNDESLVVRLDFGARRFLFTGDIEREAEAELLAHHAAELHADVLKVPHHGSRTSSSWPFVTAVNPSVAVISCGEENRFHHPNAETLAHLRGRQVYRTDRDGTVLVSTDGHDLHVDLPDAGGPPIDVAAGPAPPPRASAGDRLAEILLDP